jgi:ABC-type antimicrobial peptide transport system permease subunit
LNQAAVKALYPDGNALGQFGSDAEGKTRKRYQVIGVVADAKFEDLRSPAPPIAYHALTQDLVRDVVSAERMMALLSVFFAICALVVTAIGLYGTLAYATVSEIGVRMALGARRVQVVRMVFLENAVVATAGGGAIAAMLASRALAAFLYGISARDPWVFAGSIFALAVIASAASLLPAMRAAAIQPMQAIRCE